MKVFVFLREDQTCLSWDYYVDVLKDDENLFSRILDLVKKHYPYLSDDETILFMKNKMIDGNLWVYSTYFLSGNDYKHYLFRVLEKEIE